MNIFAILLTILAAGFTFLSYVQAGTMGEPITNAVLWLVAAMSWSQSGKNLFAAISAAIGAILLTMQITETGFMTALSVPALAIWAVAIWSAWKHFGKD